MKICFCLFFSLCMTCCYSAIDASLGRSFESFSSSEKNQCLTFFFAERLLRCIPPGNEKFSAELSMFVPSRFPSEPPGIESLVVQSNFEPSAKFLPKMEHEFGVKSVFEKEPGSFPAINFIFRAKSNFLFSSPFYEAGNHNFYSISSCRSIPFVKSALRAKIAETETGNYLAIPIFKDNRKFLFEIYQPFAEVPTKKRFAELKQAAELAAVEIFLPKIRTRCEFDFLAHFRTPQFFRGIHETELLMVKRCREETDFILDTHGIGLSSEFSVELRGIGGGGEHEQLRKFILDRPFFFVISSDGGFFCAGRITSPWAK